MGSQVLVWLKPEDQYEEVVFRIELSSKTYLPREGLTAG
ncbi:hypothetical protein M23134_00769 [Microscilla marina ATCC 23134]|uniref:Uncharacterized protein n=1 Tax=Microscilla marina ATCC 23134 TaxID=313606 RepID=A1ZS80_MICM2|nr:hypothetical protein M23134_00769 [Microscilla marina ATCC 23134]